MTTSINTNISAMTAQSNLRTSSVDTQLSIARLSSGNRIVRASDDVAALSVGTILRSDVSTLKTALTNTGQGSTVLQIADGALGRAGEILQRLKALSVQSNSDALSDTERGFLNQEFQALVSEYDRIVDETNFNGVKLINGNLASNTATIASERPAAVGDFTNQLTDTTNSISTAVLTNGLTSLTTSAVGTSDRALLAVQGDLSAVNVSSVYSGGGSLGSLSIEVNGVVFQSAFNAFDNTNVNANITLTQVLTAAEAAAGETAMAIQLDVADLNETGDQAGMDDAAEAIQAELRKMSVYQDRALENTAATDSSAITVAKFDGTVLQGMSGADFDIRGLGFDTTNGFAPSLSGFSITSNSPTNATFEVNVAGVIYSSANTVGNETGVTVNADITLLDLDGTGGGGTGVLRLTSADDANAYIDIDLATNTPGAISLTTQSEADGIAAALNGAFGSGATGGAEFQVGTEATDTIAIAITSVNSVNVFKDENGATQTLSVENKANAITASSVIDIAINTVTAVRADVGALQSRFEFAAASLEVSIQNIDAARGQFLDADISAESTDFAQNQVLIQASIAVLAQANLLPQNLLKLIG